MSRGATAGLSELQKNILLSLFGRAVDRHGVQVVTTPREEKSTGVLHPPQRDLVLLEWHPAEFTGDNTDATKRSTVSASLKKLETRGLITRRNSDGRLAGKGEQRTQYVAFTPEGGRYARELYAETTGEPAIKMRRERAAYVTAGLSLLDSTKKMAQMIAEGEIAAENAMFIVFSLDRITDLLESELARTSAN